jgi:Spy/CpxP family protein refolding chaperone
LAGTLSAQPLDGVPDGKWWKNPRVARELNLSAAQVDEIEKIFLRNRPILIDLRADLEKKRLYKDSLLEEENVDTAEAAKKIEEVEEARSKLEKARAMMFLEIRKVLTPEQREKAFELRSQMRERQQQRFRRQPQEIEPRHE